jgi:hypothetical protein
MKKSVYFPVFFLVAIFLFFACGKEENLREKLAGPKTITLYQWSKQKADGSFATIYDTNQLADIILWNNSSSNLNNVTYLGDLAPAGWFYANVGVGFPFSQPIGWYSDYEEDKSLTFWSVDKTETKYRVTYAMERKSGGVIHLETVYNTTDGVFFEVIEMKGKK